MVKGNESYIVKLVSKEMTNTKEKKWVVDTAVAEKRKSSKNTTVVRKQK